MDEEKDVVKVAISRGVYKKAQVQMRLNGYALVLFDNDPEPKLVKQENIKPIKSEAEKQIEAIYQTLSFVGDWYRDPKTVSEYIHKAGCRMTRELTDEHIVEIHNTLNQSSGVVLMHKFAREIEAHILGEN